MFPLQKTCCKLNLPLLEREKFAYKVMSQFAYEYEKYLAQTYG